MALLGGGSGWDLRASGQLDSCQDMSTNDKVPVLLDDVVLSGC